MVKKVICLLTIMLVVMFNSGVVRAEDSIMQQGKDWLSLGENGKYQGKNGTVINLPGFGIVGTFISGLIYGLTDDDGTTETGIFGDFAGMLLGIGIFVTLIVGVVLGMRLMFASVENKAKSKEALMIYIIGCVIIFGSVGIWRILVNILDSSSLY